MDAEDLELFERSLRHVTSEHRGAALDDALEELGWSEALAMDPRDAVATLFELQGEADATSSALGVVVAAALGVDGAVVLPAAGRWSPPGDLSSGSLRVDGISFASLATASEVTVVADTGDRLAAVTVPTSSLEVEALEGIDAEAGLVRVTGAGLDVVESSELPTERWDDAVARGHVAVAHELVGGATAMLDLARTHAVERIQFGQAIAGFQAVRHRLAETLVAIEMARAVIDAAWLDPSPTSAAIAKAVAGRSARTAARHCQQVLAGIGFTTEHTLHLHVRRSFVLDELFGTSVTLTKQFGDDLAASRKLPPLLPL
jgi:hypothetical protein